MTNQEFAVFTNDRTRADAIFSEQLKGNMLEVDLTPIYRNINKQKFEADMYGKPYVSVFSN